MAQTNEINYWISVSEHLPKNNDDVIVWDKIKGTTSEDYYSRSGHDAGWMKSRQDAVTHWMKKRTYESLLRKTIKPPANTQTPK